MTFFSLVFLMFFVVTSICVQITPNIKWQRMVFLVANIIFYAYWDVRFLLLLFIVILMCYFAGLRYQKQKKKLWIHIAVIGCLVILLFCKYTNFFIETFAGAFHIQNYVTLNIILPLGISFYLFQAMSYLFDVKKGTIEAEKDFIKFATYISFFPQVTSGPIVKARDFLPQLERIHRIKKENLYKGMQLFLIGLTKKVVFADRIGIAVNAVFEAPLAYNSVSILFAIIGYSIQIYCDFSGYSDMAIGIATIWDFDLGKNFNAPYLAKNPSDFWRRWHISLSSWFRDYVYIPMGGSRKGKLKTYWNLFLTMVLSGLWHGANITFVVWGCLHGIGSMLNKAWRDIFGKPKGKSSAFTTTVCIILNNIFVSIAWVIFRSDNMQQVFEILSGLFKANGIIYINVYVVCYAVVIGVFNVLAMYRNKGNVITINMNLDKMKNKVLLATWIFAIIMLMYCGNSAFIYAQF